MTPELISVISTQLIPALIILGIIIVIVCIAINQFGKRIPQTVEKVGKPVAEVLTNPAGIGYFLKCCGEAIVKGVEGSEKRKELNYNKINEENKKFKADMETKLNALKENILNINKNGEAISELTSISDSMTKQLNEMEQRYSELKHKFSMKINFPFKYKYITLKSKTDHINSKIEAYEENINSEKKEMMNLINELANSFKNNK